MRNELQRHKRSDKVKWVFTGIMFILAFVMIAGLALQVFGTGKAKPSEWFKKDEQAEQTAMLCEESAENANFLIAPRAASYSTVSTYAVEYAAPPCEHFEERISNPIDKGDQAYYLSLTTSQSTSNIKINDRISGESFSSDDYPYVYFAEYTGSGRSSYYTVAYWCFHNAKSYFSGLGYTFSNFSANWNGQSISSDWNQISTKPNVEEFYDSESDILLLKIACSFYYASNKPQPHCHFPASMSFYANKAKFLPPDPVKEGYTFTGWYTDEACTNRYEGDTITDDTVLYAGWQINTYTLSLNANGGEISEATVSGDYNTVPTIPTPTRTGHTFTGWKTEAGEVYDISSPFTQNLTLTALWQINTYTLTLNANGGEISEATVSGDYNTVPTIPTPTRTGHTFTGWKTEAGEVYDISSPLTQNLTLTAQWKIKTYTVTFIVDGVVYQTITVEHGSTFTSAAESINLNLVSVFSESGVMAYNENGEMVVVEDSAVEAQEMSKTDKVINTMLQHKWQIVGGVAGGVALIAVIAAVCGGAKRKRRH